MNLKQAAWFSAVPWGTMAISGYVAGASSDYLIKAGYSLTFVRKIMQVIFENKCHDHEQTFCMSQSANIFHVLFSKW